MKPTTPAILLCNTPFYNSLSRRRGKGKSLLLLLSPAFSPRNPCGWWVLSARQHSSVPASLLEKGADRRQWRCLSCSSAWHSKWPWGSALHWGGAGDWCLPHGNQQKKFPKRKARSSVGLPSLALLLKNTNKLPEKQQAFRWARSFPLVLFVYWKHFDFAGRSNKCDGRPT